MCGIAGIYKFNKATVTTEELKKMTDAAAHRGPDGEGHWMNEERNVGFGHRRLSIIDLSDNAKQPMTYANGRYTITYNGEIYNYIEIKEQLIKRGYTFKSSSDTEVILALYDLKKGKMLADLDGMFALAIWDNVDKRLFCARDRFGEKPFHFYIDSTCFIFASEIKQFWALGIEKIVDANKLLRFVKSGEIDNANNLSETFFRNIKRLDAAHFMLIDNQKKFTIEKYWDIDLGAKPFEGTIEQASETYLKLFTDSIRLRLRSDVPVGSSLSGGIDSSSIVMLIDRLKGKELKQNTFSARFKDFGKDEGKYIDDVVKSCNNVEVHFTWLDAAYFESVFDKVTYCQDEPYNSASIVAQYAVMELAKKNNVTVLLDGQGADEQLAGYIHYYHTYLHQLFYSTSPLYKSEFEAYNKYHGQIYPYHPIPGGETLRMKVALYKRKLLNQEMPYKNQLNIDLHKNTTRTGLKELLRYADRNSMAHSREVRLPFLSHKLVEFVFSLPGEFKINQGWTKYVLRRAMEHILPPSVCWRVDKVAFEPPQDKWLQSERFTAEIKNASKLMGIDAKDKEDKKVDVNYNWRLLMAAKFIS